MFFLDESKKKATSLLPFCGAKVVVVFSPPKSTLRRRRRPQKKRLIDSVQLEKT
tara:strand:- start:124 stop:285 length:162 start_codon:yes stop_codon:yes gene_type:complete